jgi:DNA-binding MarR family transcriptional regulator
METRPIGFWVKIVDRLLEEQFTATIEEHGVTRRQWQVLNVLALENATLEQLDAAIASPPEPSTRHAAAESAAEQLGELVESEWVVAAVDGFELTDRGRSAFDRLASVVATQRSVDAAGISAEQYSQTVAVLERMARNLGWHEPA